MQKLIINLVHCYGIKKFEQTFDFAHADAHAVYAPNGVMKSSLAKVFQNIIDGKKQCDEIYPERITTCSITDETGADLQKENVFVIGSHNFDFESKKQSTLLVKRELQEEFTKILSDVEEKKSDFLKQIKSYTGYIKDNDKHFSELYGKSEKDFLHCLKDIKELVGDKSRQDFSDLKYKELFNPNVIKFLNTAGIKEKIESYIENYNSLVEQSNFFNKDAFDHYNASTISDSLEKNGFFKAKHGVYLNSAKSSGVKIEIDSLDDLRALIKTEKEKILSDKELEGKFDALEKEIRNSEELRVFHSIIKNNKEIITKLGDLNAFKKEVWASYFKKEEAALFELIKLYEVAEKRMSEIIVEAQKEYTEWKSVVEIFNKRFDVPFKVTMSNQDDVMLHGHPPKSIFVYEDTEEKEIRKEDLVKLLSTGERRALYILNIIFELEARKKAGVTTLLVIDDIADSFDYKNKYAILEYLKETIEESNFQALILTHNFDFYRTVASRLLSDSKWTNCHITMKTKDGVKLELAKRYLDVFSEWKKDIKSSDEKIRNKVLIAAIPFVRNLIEYSKGDDDSAYIKLTALLHQKDISKSISIADLLQIFSTAWNADFSKVTNTSQITQDLIYKLADDSLGDVEGINLENKIILSIAIRLKAEAYLIKEINDSAFVATLSKNQTHKLLKKYKAIGKTKNLKLLDQVTLMTPENIHFNSFMYEPILDMSDSHLKTLYTEISKI